MRKRKRKSGNKENRFDNKKLGDFTDYSERDEDHNRMKKKPPTNTMF